MATFLLFLGLSTLLFISLLLVLQFSCRIKSVSKNGEVVLSSYPLIGCLISYYKNRRRLIDWYTEILSMSPSQTVVLSRFGAPRTIVTANAKNVEYILKSNFNNYPKGKKFTEILGDFLGVGIFNVDGEKWNEQRKFASHEFSAKSLRESVFVALNDVVRTRLDPLLNSSAESNAVLDLQDVLRRFAFDTICKVILGADPFTATGLDLISSTSPLSEAMDRASELCARRGSAPVYAVWKFKRLLNLGSEKLLREAVGKVHECVNEIIQAKKEKLIKKNSSSTAGGRDDLLSRSLIAGYDDEIVRDMVISFLMAGRDTTSAALTWFFWLLSRHEIVHEKLVDELTNSLEKIGGKNRLENSLDFLNVNVLKELNYMTACLYESMRLYPPVAWDSKHAKEDDILPDGTVVYKGNRLTYFQYGMGRMENLWGKDCTEFRPERWFDENGTLKIVNPYEFPVFQAGPRICLGKEMALIQMKYVAASILSKFEIKPVHLNQPVFVPHMTAYMAGGFNVRVFSKGNTNTIYKK